MDPYSFERIVEIISQPHHAGDFPPEVLRNRLAIMGVKEVFDDQAISKLGLPFRYYHPLDEAILILHYFLTKSNQLPGSYIQINTTHVPTKEEENTLSFWKSPKAGLYLDLHSLIENNNKKNCPNAPDGLIKRLFVFRDNAHLAFLESTGIGVILEQQSIGIKTGFILTSRQEQHLAEMIRAGTVLIQLIHPDDEHCEWALGVDRIDAEDQPYGNYLICKWHQGKIKDSLGNYAQAPIDIKEYLQLFEFIRGTPEVRTGKASYCLAEEPSEFSELLRENFKVSLPRIGAPEAHKAHYEEQFKFKTIPNTLKQFYEALKRTRESKVVKAIDASSVRSTLRIHDADPNYRHWIRATVNMAIKDENVSLERIYILDLDPTKDDYKVFEQEIMLYRDFLLQKISRLDKVWPPEEMGGTNNPSSREPLVNSKNIKLYANTRNSIQAFCEALPVVDKGYALSWLKKGDFIQSEREATTPTALTNLISTYMPQLDFLYTEQLVFNYKDYKGQPGQAVYDADLFVPGDPNESQPDIITFLEEDEFQDKRDIYEKLFKLLIDISVPILPPVGEDVLPTPDELTSALNIRRDEFLKGWPQGSTPPKVDD